jgi:hypothetical protein
MLLSKTVGFPDNLRRVVEILMTLTESFARVLRLVSRYSHECRGLPTL